ncbi:hypothetical protein NKH18_45335 [Streptomyces sp. M10(2022)]
MEEINFSPEVRTMLFVLLGEMPLQARENLAWESRNLYLNLGNAILELSDAIQVSISDAGTSLPPEVADAYIQGLSLLVNDGGIDHLREAVDQLAAIGDGQIDYSQKIQQAKWEIIAEIITLILELAFLAAMAYFTGGLSLTEMIIARSRSKTMLLMTIHRLVNWTGIAPGISQAIEEAIQSLAVQLAQIGLNSGERKPTGIDWSDVGKAAAIGGLTGFLSGPLGGLGDHFISKYLKNNLDNLFKSSISI